MASKSLGTLTIDLVAKVGGFQTGMTKAQREADKRAAAIERRLKKMGVAIDAAFKIAAAAAVAAFGAITVGVGRAIDGMDRIAKSSQKVGVGTEALSKLAYAAELSGVEFGQLEGALAKLAKSRDMAAQGSKEQLDIFRALGVEFQRADGTLRNTDEVLADIADRFQALPDGSTKTAAAMALLGRSGAQLIPLLNGGSQGLSDMGDELERLGGVVTPEAAKQSEQFNDNITRLKTAVDSLWIGLAKELLPDLIKFTEEMVDSAKKGDGLAETVRDVAEGIRAMGTAAQFAVDLVQALTFSVIGLYNAAKGLEQFSLPGVLSRVFTPEEFTFKEDFRNAGVAFGLAGDAFDGGSAAAPKFDFEASERAGQAAAEQAKRARDAAEQEKKLADALKKQREEQEKATAARKAAAEAARAQALADREAAAQARAFEATQAALGDILRKQAEEMGGPLAQAAFQYQDTMVELAGVEQELIRLGKLDEEQTNRLALARKGANEQYQKTVEAIQSQIDPLDALLSSMDMELSLMRMGNTERVTELELQRLIYEYRQKGIELSEQEIESARERIRVKAEEIEALGKQINELDRFRSSFADNVAGVLDGSKSIKDALRDLVDDFIAQLARLAAQNFTQSLFGQQGTPGGGGLGSLFGSLFGAFGGARAAGGPVLSGVPYLVGEKGPELVVPNASGTVIPAAQTAALMGRGARGGDTFVIQGATSRRSIERLRMDRDRADRKAQREFS